MYKPYVVSGDIQTLVRKWAGEKGLALPGTDFFEGVIEQFNSHMKDIFSQYEYIPEADIRSEFQHIASESGLPIVSLEAAYLITLYHVDLARMVDVNACDKGLGSRNGVSLETQISNIAQIGLKEVVLADDVIFTGTQILRVTDLLAKKGIRVVQVCAAIGIGSGVRSLLKEGLDVTCVRMYDQVIDQVCERDFYPGIPHSGRILASDNRFASHYVYEQMASWASLPSKGIAHQFTRQCCERARCLFNEIEILSGMEVRNKDLPHMFQGYNGDEQVTEILDEIGRRTCSIGLP